MAANKMRVITRYFEGADLTPAQLLEMSNLRRSVMGMKPETDLAQDFAGFCEFCQSCFLIALFCDPDGKVVGTTCYAAQRGTTPAGQRYLLIVPDYSFMLPEYRGHPAYVHAILRMGLRLLRLWRGEQIWFGSVAYPSAMLLYEEMFAQVYLCGDPDLPPVAHLMLDWMLQNVAGSRWDAQAGCINMPTIPPVMSDKWLANAELRPMYQRYIVKCPDWRNGYALAGVARMNLLGMFLAGLRKLQRRSGRRA
ncbi:MAG: hypothetical protein RL748_3730 [Pseudomonadota bacterium]